MERNNCERSAEELLDDYTNTVGRMRLISKRLLTLAGTEHKATPFEGWRRVLPFLGYRASDNVQFNSTKTKGMDLVTNAITGGKLTLGFSIISPLPLLIISPIEIRVSGKQTRTGEFINVVRYELAMGTNDPHKNMVVFPSLAIPQRMTFWSMMQSSEGNRHIVGMTMKSLETFYRIVVAKNQG